jgi:hypothetical protein
MIASASILFNCVVGIAVLERQAVVRVFEHPSTGADGVVVLSGLAALRTTFHRGATEAGDEDDKKCNCQKIIDQHVPGLDENEKGGGKTPPASRM